MARKIEYREVTIDLGTGPNGEPQTQRLNYRGQILMILRAPLGGGQRGGATNEDVVDSVRVMNKVEKDPLTGPLVLDEDLWKHLRNKVKAFPFPFCVQEIVDFIKTVEEAEEVELKVVEGEGEKADPAPDAAG